MLNIWKKDAICKSVRFPMAPDALEQELLNCKILVWINTYLAEKDGGEIRFIPKNDAAPLFKDAFSPHVRCALTADGEYTAAVFRFSLPEVPRVLLDVMEIALLLAEICLLADMLISAAPEGLTVPLLLLPFFAVVFYVLPYLTLKLESRVFMKKLTQRIMPAPRQ